MQEVLKKHINIHTFLIALLLTFSLVTGTAFANEESDAHNKKGTEYFNNAKNAQYYQNALKEFNVAIKADPNDDNISTYYSNRGSTYFKLGSNNYDKALKDLGEAIKRNKNNSGAYYWRAKIYEEQGKSAEAKKDWNTTGDLDYKNKDYKSAVTKYTSAINIDGKNSLYYTNRGWAHYQLKEFDEAKKDFDKAITLKSNYSNAYRGRAWVYEAQDKKEDAISNYLKAAISGKDTLPV